MKKVENEKKAQKRLKKVVWPGFGFAKHPKASWNTQHLPLNIQLNNTKMFLNGDQHSALELFAQVWNQLKSIVCHRLTVFMAPLFHML